MIAPLASGKGRGENLRVGTLGEKKKRGKRRSFQARAKYPGNRQTKESASYTAWRGKKKREGRCLILLSGKGAVSKKAIYQSEERNKERALKTIILIRSERNADSFILPEKKRPSLLIACKGNLLPSLPTGAPFAFPCQKKKRKSSNSLNDGAKGEREKKRGVEEPIRTNILFAQEAGRGSYLAHAHEMVRKKERSFEVQPEKGEGKKGRGRVEPLWVKS